MIWFACKQCGKRHKQPEDAAGSLIFCECGQANRVPDRRWGCRRRRPHAKALPPGESACSRAVRPRYVWTPSMM